MKDPVWILKSVVLAIHAEQLVEHGGKSGLRDPGLLDSALTRPQNLYHYEETDLFELAASYAYGLIKNHPFIDGNKRISFVVSVLFLSLNGYTLVASREEKVTNFLSLAGSKLSEKELAAWFKIEMSSSISLKNSGQEP